MSKLQPTDTHNESKIQKANKKYFLSLSKQEQEDLIKKFEVEKITSDILKTMYKKDGMEGTLIKIMFFGYIKQ